MDKVDYIGLISHEVKTPIATISGYADIIQSGMADEEITKRYAGNIYRESNRMAKLVDNLVYIVKYMQNELVPQLYEKAINRIVSNAVERILVENMDKGFLDIKITGNAEGMIDEFMLEEAVYQILDNAVIYGNNTFKNNSDLPYASIDINISTNDGKVIIKIADCGQGMNREDTEKVFDIFYRVDKKYSRSIGCNGLGLPVAKCITAVHGGECLIESKVGDGTKVTLIV